MSGSDIHDKRDDLVLGSASVDDQVGHEYRVGFGKPPRQSQFKKGQSGNPSGRPIRRVEQSLDQSIQTELDKRLTLPDGRRTSKRNIAATTLVNKAIKGDRHAIDVVYRADAGLSLARGALKEREAEQKRHAEKEASEAAVRAEAERFRAMMSKLIKQNEDS